MIDDPAARRADARRRLASSRATAPAAARPVPRLRAAVRPAATGAEPVRRRHDQLLPAPRLGWDVLHGQGGPGRRDRRLRGVLPVGLRGDRVLLGVSDTGTEFLFFAAVAPLVVPAPLLIWRATRPWAVGLFMGTAVASIGMSGLCASLISSL